MTIKRYTDFIAEQQRKLRGAGLAEAKKMHPMEKYPPEHNLHLLTGEPGEEDHHVIQGMAHTEENETRVQAAVDKAARKITKEKGVSSSLHKDLTDELGGHFRPEQDGPFVQSTIHLTGPVTKVHKSMEDYVNYHAPRDAKWIVDNSKD